jgi:hypothetical protein
MLIRQRKSTFVAAALSAALFLVAIALSVHFRIPSAKSPSQIEYSFTAIVVVALIFMFVCLTFGQFVFNSQSKNLTTAITAIVLALIGVAVFLESVQRSIFVSYGDFETLIGVVKGIDPRTVWALGSSIISSIYVFINGFVSQISVVKFLSVLSSLFVLGSTLFTINISKGRLSYLLPIICPMWIGFCFGYDEYNTFMAPVFLFVALWMFHGKQPEKVFVTSIVAGLLPALYIGFAPISFFVLLKLLSPRKNSKDLLTAISICLISFFGAIEFSWPAGHLDYLKNLPNDMLLGSVGGFEGKAFSEKSAFLNLASIFSLEHWSGIAYMIVFGGGLVVAIFTVAVLFGPTLFLPRVRSSVVPAISIGWIQILFLAWNLFYLVAIMAKLGPTGDVDMFYSTYISVSIFVGLVIDRVIELRGGLPAFKRGLLWLVAATNGPLIAGLVIFGVQRSCDNYAMVRGWCGP